MLNSIKNLNKFQASSEILSLIISLYCTIFLNNSFWSNIYNMSIKLENDSLFFIINTSKIPFNTHLGIITLETLKLALYLAPFVILGALFGQKIMKKLNQRAFEYAALISTLIAGFLLFIPR